MKNYVLADTTGSLRDIYKILKELKIGRTIYINTRKVGYSRKRWDVFVDKLQKAFKMSSAILGKRIVLADYVAKYFVLLAHEFVFLNHGWGTKMTPPRWKWNDEGLYNHFKIFLRNRPYIICLSEFDSEYFLKAPGLDNSQARFVPLGHPRNDYLVRNRANISIAKKVRREFSIPDGAKVILYAPTHREFPELTKRAYSRIVGELKNIDEKLSRMGYFILFRPHYYLGGMKAAFEDMKAVKYAGKDVVEDNRDLMIASDILMTDYSSIFVDYLLLKKPVVFYPFDIEEYEKLRGLVIDFSNLIHTPGPKLSNLSEIFEALDDLNRYSRYLEKSLKHFHKHTDDGATERLIEFLKKL